MAIASVTEDGGWLSSCKSIGVGALGEPQQAPGGVWWWGGCALASWVAAERKRGAGLEAVGGRDYSSGLQLSQRS